MIILNDTLGAVGGSHTLFLRMCDWYRKQGVEVSFFCNNRDNEEIASHLEEIGVSIHVIDTTDIKATYRLLKMIDDGKLQIINFWSNRYLDIEAIKWKYKIEIDNYIYLIHPRCLIKGDSYKSKNIILKAIQNGYKRLIPKMCENNAIISADEINIMETEKYYDFRMIPQPPIIRLPMKIDSVDRDVVIREGFESKIIMTSCRADFPYKGYVVGLIDEYAELKKNYPEIRLHIVCDGEDIGVLKEKINQTAKEIRDSIELSGWMSYDELKNCMNRCMIYIGMGSSVFDSSLRYKPSAVIKFDTMECIGKDYTAENPFDMAAKENITNTAAAMIERVLRMSYEEYKVFSQRSFDEVSKVYGIDNVMNQFMNHHTKSKLSIMNRRDYRLVRMNNGINSIRFKNQKEKSSVNHLTNHRA